MPEETKAPAAQPAPDEQVGALKGAAGNEQQQQEVRETLDPFAPDAGDDAAAVKEPIAGEPEKAEPEKDAYDAARPAALPPPEPEAAEVDGIKLTLPAGLDKDNPEIKDFVKLAKDGGTKPETIQKFIDLYLDKQKKVVWQVAEADKKFRANLDARWIRENHNDPEFGGDNYEKSCNYVTAALRKFVPADELTATLAKDGRMGFLQFVKEANIKNHPILFKLLARVGKYASEASAATSDATAPPDDKSDAEVLF